MRFDLYAPHVKHLDVYGPTGVIFKVTGWKVLVARSQRRLLLPNLQTTTIMTTCNSSGPCQPMWVGTFSSPSLVNLEITADNLSNAPTISYHAASFIMKSLTAHCPKIKRLGLFPYSIDGDHAEDAESSLLAFLSGDKFYEYVSTLTSLIHLSCTFAWLQVPALRILGRLPHLESIAVCGVDHADDISELTEDLFPMLHRLTLHGSSCSNTLETLGTLSMVKNLTLLHVKLDIDTEDLDIDEDVWLAEEFFPLLLNAPRLTDVKIDADSSHNRGDGVKIGESVLRIFQRLPLKSLHLDAISLSNEALRFDLASVWPSVTHLKLPQQDASMTTISCFATLPELRHLELRLDFYYPPHEFSPTVSPLVILEASFGSAICSNFEDMDRIAHTLLDIFPKLTRIAWAGDQLPALAVQPAIERVGFLNGHLSTLRELQALKKLSTVP
ncbi:hypothetical protein FRC09_020411 [Ceratobasidium sp. 395]|nr:hypothetical protein FRC09_020411 [Ceratobasidium sp. 395]